MALKIVTHAERPDLLARWSAVSRRVWPEFMLHDEVTEEYWGGLTGLFPECQLYVVDDETDALAGIGSTVPVVWDGSVAGLPDGLDAVLTVAIGQHEAQPPPTALCALQAGVVPEHRGTGLSSVIIRAMREVAARLGVSDLIAPVRPNQKALYPLTPMERYIHWRRPDGLPFDAWMRVHARLGAEIVKVADPSMTIRGTIAEWEAWTGLAFPESGPYVVTGALTPVTIDRQADQGLYVEPNVWMRHRLSR